jgi:hypothetical protein
MRAATTKHACLAAFLSAALAALSIARPLFAQTTVGTGSIVGTVSDPPPELSLGPK